MATARRAGTDTFIVMWVGFARLQRRGCHVLAFLALLLLAGPVSAMSPSGTVLLTDAAKIRATWRGGLVITLPLSEAVPYGVGVTEDPARLNVRFAAPLTFDEPTDVPSGMELVQTSGAGAVLGVALPDYMVLSAAEMSWSDTGGATLSLLLRKADQAEFHAEAARWRQTLALSPPPPAARPSQDGLHVMIDPGHGGIDPGAEYDNVREADLVLSMARELRDRLVEAGVRVTLTRDADQFVSLSERVARATRAGADVFVSLHADAVQVGHASGASVHSLPDSAAERGNAFLMRHLGQNALASTSGAQDDATTRALIEMARARTLQDAQTLSRDLLDEMRGAGLTLYKTPMKQSNFVVLRAADVPSVLVELGYLSEPADRARLIDPQWRARMAAALSAGLLRWAGSAVSPGIGEIPAP